MRRVTPLAMAMVLAVAPSTVAGSIHDAGIDGEAAPQDAPTPADDADPTRAQLRARVEELKEIQRRHQADILAMDDVIGIGIGRASSGGGAEFVVLVREGSSPQGIPSQLEGVLVRVESRRPVQLLDTFPACAAATCHGTQLPLPVEMGNAGGTAQSPACSLGFRACDLGSLELVFVSNAHCFARADCSMVGLNVSVLHPNGTFGNPTIGQVAGHDHPSCNPSAVNLVDATKVVSSLQETALTIRDVGTWSGTPGDPLPGDMVQKSGRTTGLSTGPVTAVNVAVDVSVGNTFCCGPLIMQEQIEWDSTPDTQGGDSGSALLTTHDLPRVAGLNWGGTGGFTYANRIQNVLASFNLSLNIAPCFPDCPFNMASANTPNPEALNELGHRFRKRVMERSEVGQELTQIFFRVSTEAAVIARKETVLAARTAALLVRFEPVLRSLVAGQRAEIKPEDLRDVDEFLKSYAAHGSEAMQRDLRRVRKMIRDPVVQRAFRVKVIQP